MSRYSILVVDDEKITSFYLRDLLARMDCMVQIAQNGEEALEMLQKRDFDLVVTDLVMPGIDGFALVRRLKQTHPGKPVFILTAHGNPEYARKARELGADGFHHKPVNAEQLQTAIRRLREKPAGSPASAARFAPSPIVGTSEAMGAVFRAIEKARASSAHVLIRGESGTGKELVARAICAGREAERRPFVVVNCCAIAEGLMESELFGHVRGAFSGALSDREGLFETADGGTIFLDEIGDLPLRSQTKLLRIIQEREFRRVGDNRVRYVDVRIIAATNRDLEGALRESTFREDLYYRLDVIPIHVPPLRSRRGDIPLLIRHFLAKHQHGSPFKVDFTPGAEEFLCGYAFPGNVRELENVVQRAISFATGKWVEREDLLRWVRPAGRIPASPPPELARMTYSDFKSRVLDFERHYLLSMLKSSGGSVSDAARAMRMTRTALHNRMKKLDIRSKELRGR